VRLSALWNDEDIQETYNLRPRAPLNLRFNLAYEGYLTPHESTLPAARAVDFTRANLRQLRRSFRRRKTMIEEERSECRESIVSALTKTSAFRSRKAKQYPDDNRNATAAASLMKLANDATELTDDSWELLQLFYDPESKCWQDAICQATKNVGFSNKSKSFPYFIRSLIALLPHHQAVENLSQVAA
jgi:hypothetical protein